jgi:hypothetical protein
MDLLQPRYDTPPAFNFPPKYELHTLPLSRGCFVLAKLITVRYDLLQIAQFVELGHFLYPPSP